MYEDFYANIEDTGAFLRRIHLDPAEIKPDKESLDKILYNHHRYVPFVQVETWNNGGWTAAGRASGASYTATDSAKVRLTYTWRRKRGFTLIVR